MNNGGKYGGSLFWCFKGEGGMVFLFSPKKEASF